MRVMKLLGNQKGMTLIELLAVVTIMSAIIMAISSVQLQFLTTHKEIQEGSFQNDETSFFIQTFTNQIRNTSLIQTQPDKVTLKQDTDEVSFTYNNTNQTITYTKGSQNIVILKNVTTFTPSRLEESGKVGVDLKIEVITGKQTVPLDIKAFSYIGTNGL